MANSPPSRLQALLLLDGYSRCQQGAQTHYKSTLWNLNKARRQKSRESLASGTISAEDVREELRARAVLLEKIPDLAEEDSGERVSGIDTCDQWTLVDVVEEMSTVKENAPYASKSASAEGLRNRKKINNITEVDKKGMGVQEESIPGEDDRLRNADPVTFFGAFPPKDLKEAQKEAKAMLEAYIQAANLATAIISLTKENK
jgi:hypothetical protein